MTTRIKVSFWIDCASFNEPIEHDLLSSVLADDKLDTIISDVAGFVVGKLKKEQQGVYMAGIDNITVRALNVAKPAPDVVEIQPQPIADNPEVPPQPPENIEEHKWTKKRIESLDGKSSNLWWQCEKCRATPTLVVENRPNENKPDTAITICRGFPGSKRQKLQD